MNKSVKNMSITALLIAMGITIPMVMPKITIPPASYTLASHVPVFISMFISPYVAIAVVLGTAWGFFMTTPLVIALRALSHIVFAFLGALYIKDHQNVLQSNASFWGFNIGIGIIHAFFEAIVVLLFYTSSKAPMPSGGLVRNLLIFIGLGGFIHSLIDFYIARVILMRLPN